jgi:LPS-assembly protein
MMQRTARWCSASALALVAALATPMVPAHAQSADPLAPNLRADAQMLLEADQLIYDNDRNVVTARGGVQIDYDGNRLVARQVSYDRNTGRLVASGNVELIDPEGTKISSEEIDITDDFGDGFANALRVETADKTYFGAESAVRRDGNVTTFNNSVYTACAPCEENPERPPVWRFKSRTIIWNAQKKTIRFSNARFEMFGLPIAYLPVFEVPDHTVKRKTGFLMPGISYKSELGVGVTVPFYLALDPTYDLTVWGTYYTRQGFLAEAEWRQQFDNGQYSIRMAGINQQNPDAFKPNSVSRGPAGDPTELRGMIGTKGAFQINPRWAFGWDVLIQSDKDFARKYGIDGFDTPVVTNEVYLTGLNERNYFDLRGYRFQVQEERFDSDPIARNPRQPWVLPSFDYVYIPDDALASGELRFDVNSRTIYRDFEDYAAGAPALRGYEGLNSRTTAEAEWKRQIVTPTGLVITPLLHLQGDATHADLSAGSAANAAAMAGALNANPAYLGPTAIADVRSSYYRYMATAGLDLRYPILFSGPGSSHILEPIAQLFVRPDEPLAERLGLANEDAQSLVFDATTLFERDKFSGYDRIEGGTRANLGLRYSGSYANGWGTNVIVGQSYHLAGANSYAQPDLVNAGAYSGLETARSDYVALVGATSPDGVSLATAGRFDEETLEVRRAELRAGYSSRPLSVSARYAYIQAQPLYGFDVDRHEVTLTGSARVGENWRVFGGGTYDLESDLLVRDQFGFAYDDECFTLSLSMVQSRAPGSTDVNRSFGFNIGFRTLGEFGSSTREIR